jgi:Holliday junction resolvase
MYHTSSSQNVGPRGEVVVRDDLRNQGWAVLQNTRLPGSTDIEATKNNTTILVQVKSALSPSTPANLSSDETRNIKSRASNIEATAYLAQVQFYNDRAGNLTHDKPVYTKLV